MSSENVEKQIQELETLRKNTRVWRLGATVAAFAVVIICVGIMNGAVQGLIRPGPVQEEFVKQIGDGLKDKVVPQVQQLAMQTIQDSRPLVEKGFAEINSRVPDLTAASMKEFETLQKNLPMKAEKVLDDTFGEMLKEREAKIREVFPDATDEKLHAFITNITEEGHTRLNNINHQLFDPHIRVMSSIAGDMMAIEKQEAAHIKGEIPTWQMALLFTDILRADLNELAMPGLDGKGKSGTKKPGKN